MYYWRGKRTSKISYYSTVFEVLVVCCSLQKAIAINNVLLCTGCINQQLINATQYLTALIVFLEPHINKLHYLPTVLCMLFIILGAQVVDCYSLCLSKTDRHMNIEVCKVSQVSIIFRMELSTKKNNNAICIISIQSNSRED